MASYLRFCLRLLCLQLPPRLRLQNMPIDIILNEILPKLPVKSLVRFKAVCKLFNTFISSPEFARVHLSQSNNRHLVTSDGKSALYSYHLDYVPCSTTSPKAFIWRHKTTLSILGSCNGLLLLSHSYKIPRALIILNPATRSYIDVPFSSIVPFEEKLWLGFGFDQSSQDYKIIMVSENTVTHTRMTIVYSVNLRLWKVVDLILSPLDLMGQRYDGLLINNHLLHWLFRTANDKRRIGCFDVCSERWTDDVLLPHLYYHRRPGIFFIAIGALDGCLFCMFDNIAMNHTDVWVMKEYGVQKSWIKLFTFGHFISFLDFIPVACRGPDLREVLLKERSGSILKLMWYNTKNNSYKMANNITGFSGQQPFMYNGSLVSLPGAKLFGDKYKSLE